MHNDGFDCRSRHIFNSCWTENKEKIDIHKLALLWGEAQLCLPKFAKKKGNYSNPRITYRWPKVTFSGPKAKVTCNGPKAI